VQTRYTAVRRQTAPAPGARETQVLDYQNVASDLLPTVAAAYALKFMGQVPCRPLISVCMLCRSCV
jgi:hypothetical protein